MSTPTANGGGRGNAPRQRELVYCHRCQDEWFRDENGLVCPSCGSDFVEIMESNSADPTRRPPRIPGAFEDEYDSSDGENGEHNSGRFSSSFLFQAPGIMISRTSGNPMATVTSTTHPGGTEGEAGQPGGITGPNMVEMLQTIFSSIMGDQGIERVRQQVQGEPGAGAGEAAPGATGGDHAPQDPMTRGNAPPMPPGLAGLFGGGQPPVGSRFVYERHTIPPRGTVPVDDLHSCVALFLWI
ncbi:hypothetical protein BGX38DRAFT_1175019 [Terfezia claveryi]|nr:hypothetical protein BGX38DRAFT_1175019 [Terfezia claveryi]